MWPPRRWAMAVYRPEHDVKTPPCWRRVACKTRSLVLCPTFKTSKKTVGDLDMSLNESRVSRSVLKLELGREALPVRVETGLPVIVGRVREESPGNSLSQSREGALVRVLTTGSGFGL